MNPKLVYLLRIHPQANFVVGAIFSEVFCFGTVLVYIFDWERLPHDVHVLPRNNKLLSLNLSTNPQQKKSPDELRVELVTHLEL